MLSACGFVPVEPLDSFQQGDVHAKPGDIKIIEGSRYSVRTKIDDKIRDLLQYGTRDERRQSIFLARGIYRPLDKLGISLKQNLDDSVLPELENDGKNLIITQTIAANKDGEAYKLVITARQGSYFWERAVERGVGNEHPRIPVPVWKNPIEGNIYGQGKKTMEESRIAGIHLDRAQFVSEFMDEVEIIRSQDGNKADE